MVSQYPHSITVTIKPRAVQDPNTGDYAAVTGSDAVHTFDCRAEINGRGYKIAGQDGSLIDFTFTVYMPQTDTIVPYGAAYSLTMGAKVVTGKVKGANNGQFNSRIWL